MIPPEFPRVTVTRATFDAVISRKMDGIAIKSLGGKKQNPDRHSRVRLGLRSSV